MVTVGADSIANYSWVVAEEGLMRAPRLGITLQGDVGVQLVRLPAPKTRIKMK